jgi:hypothetical protein
MIVGCIVEIDLDGIGSSKTNKSIILRCMVENPTLTLIKPCIALVIYTLQI